MTKWKQRVRIISDWTKQCVRKCNYRNNRYDTMRDECVWHSRLLTNLPRFINLFFVTNEVTK